jgi:hypothetical protein
MLCLDCENTIVQEVAEIASLADNFRITITRQTALNSANRSRSSTETPIPFNDKASRERAVLLAAAWRWTMHLWDQAEPLPTGRHGGLAGIGRWLHARINRILDHPDAGDLANDIHRHSKRAWRTLDRPEPGIFAGVCSSHVPISDRTPRGQCAAWLYAKPNAATVSCPHCGHHHDVAERRATLREHAEHMLMTAAELARAVTWLGENIKPDLIRKWAERGRLHGCGHSPEGRPLYRVGDVLTLIAQQAEKEQAKAS